MSSFVKRLGKRTETVILMVILVLCVVITCINPNFLLASNIVSIIKNNLVVGILAMGMTMVMISGGIDLSVGSSVSAVSYLISYFLVNVSDNLFLAFVVGLLCGGLIGYLNYAIIVKINVPPMVATLSTMSILSGVLLYVTLGNRINVMPDSMNNFAKISLLDIDVNGRISSVPVQLLFFVAICLITWFVLNYTRIGRGIFAIGGHGEFAKRVGYDEHKILRFAYVFLGLMVGVASFVSVSILRQADPSGYSGLEFSVIAVVVLGGVSISGGYGSVFGAILGTLLMGVIQNGLVLAFIPTYWQDIIVGVVILFAIASNYVQEARKEKHAIKVDV